MTICGFSPSRITRAIPPFPPVNTRKHTNTHTHKQTYLMTSYAAVRSAEDDDVTMYTTLVVVVGVRVRRSRDPDATATT